MNIVMKIYAIGLGSPTPGPRTGTGPWPIRNRAAQCGQKKKKNGGRSWRGREIEKMPGEKTASPREKSFHYPLLAM